MPAPQYCPSPRELDDLELLLSGALAPRASFDPEGQGVTLSLPADLVGAAPGGGVELVDPEGLPLALYRDGALESLSTPSYGPFRRLHRTPAQTRLDHPGAVTVPVTAPLTDRDLSLISARAAGHEVVLLALTGVGTPQHVSPVGLVRVTLAARHLLEHDGITTHVVAAPLASHDDPALDEELRSLVSSNYATGAVDSGLLAVPGEGTWPEEIATIIAADLPGEDERGLVIFFTGLSGSGKSTLAQALRDQILENGRRTVTSLDGDVVRRNLSAGLTFSKADRETNIRRIGWVAAEIARHRGIAICSPIAPFDQTRQQVRRMVHDAGGQFVLVHVATPLQECERRDRKGLYAKARAGEIAEFTGISSPYEEPRDATVRIDTTGRSVEDALADLLPYLPLDGAADG